jgi:Flp pilus assembly protein TadG
MEHRRWGVHHLYLPIDVRWHRLETSIGGDVTSKRRRQTQSGISVIMTAMMLTMIVPFMGLAIDVTLLYVDKARLQGAVDGAALAGAKSLSRGSNDAAQQAAAVQEAKNFVYLNYPTSFFFTNSVTINMSATPNPDIYIDESVTNQRTVNVTAHANVPALFMQYLNFTSTTLTASATVTRRDLNVMFVMDRSGSLANSGSCTPAKLDGVSFLNYFALGTDNVGLITFASSSRVDSPLSTAFSGMATIIGSVNCTGATSSAQALWTGYQALATLNQPAALNVIVFFTDGQPTAVTADLPIATGSSCTTQPPNTFRGVFTVGFETTSPFSPVGTGGVFDYQAPVQPMNSDAIQISGAEGNPQGCAFVSNWGNAYQDIAGVPTTDVWGNNLNNGYQSVTLSGGLVSIPSNSTGALNMINASTNAADNAGYRIRQATSSGSSVPGSAAAVGTGGLSNVVIFTIGLGNSTYPANGDLLERIANDPRASSYDSTKPAGLYVYAATTADLSSAFAAVAAQILRIAK